ncbi:nucleotide exchange factor GrpE [Fangia hongkongensis]|uniref:nucleotide exchange factor GrpE n=1 Tax=Fangia hongkongensis TaxID=270495 RepID=UPI00036A267D|nr:nucleotide exchange factor GrpE [Fangia hongkongensis]MBK2124246.1 nucleotide exchange factor GrpE [Fangia hongkongensis]
MTKHKKSHQKVEGINEEIEQMAAVQDEVDATDNQNAALKAKIDALEAKINANEQKVLEAKDSVLRAHAEMENIRRRAQKDVESAHKYSLEKFANALLPVLDSMEKAVEAAAHAQNAEEMAKGVTSMAEGVELTMKMLVDTMEKFGVEQIDPQGEAFDPNEHEAMAMQPHPEFDDNQVMDVFQKGYKLNNRIVRPARVVVVKNS